MGRVPRSAPGGYVYHALNRAVARLPLFEKPTDYEAFERKRKGDAALFISCSQTLFGNAAEGKTVSRAGPDAKQNFAEGRSQTEFGNEKVRGEEEPVPALPNDKPAVNEEELLDRLYEDAGADGYWTTAYVETDSPLLRDDGVGDVSVALAVALAGSWIAPANVGTRRSRWLESHN
jgi:hypothetical protein